MYAKFESYKGAVWVCCPVCGWRQFRLGDAKIEKLRWKCKDTHCKRSFEVSTVRSTI